MMATAASSQVARSCRAMLGVTALLLAATPHFLSAQAKALSLAEVIDLRQHGVSSHQILRSAREYCIAFSMDDSTRRQLTVAGADTLLVGELSNVCSTARPPEPPPPPPLINDAFAESNTSQGFTWANPHCKASFETEGVRFENTSNDALCMVRYPSRDLPSDLRLDLDVGQLGATPRGIVYIGFGRQERSASYYSVSMSADRHVELCWYVDGVCNSLLSLSGVAAVQADANAVNKLSVEMHGQDIVVLVNDKNVGQYAADGTLGGKLLVGVGPQTSLLLVRLRATPNR
jgi:hypothetical protein